MNDDFITTRIWEPRPAWFDQASCRHLPTSMFYPERGESTSRARAVCAKCPVQDQCQQWAFDTGERFGIWGGVSVDRARRRAIRANRSTLNAAPIAHGTYDGYLTHRWRGDLPICDACVEAARQYELRRKAYDPKPGQP